MRDLLIPAGSAGPPARPLCSNLPKGQAHSNSATAHWLNVYCARGTGTLRLRLVRTKSRICIRLFTVTRFIRLHQGAQKGNAANYWSLFEPHYKQNLYTNPKRTAKSLFRGIDTPASVFVQILPGALLNPLLNPKNNHVKSVARKL